MNDMPHPKRKKIAVLGADGQVGRELIRTLSPLGDIISFSKKDGDLLNLPPLIEALKKHQVDIIANAAAYTAVDKAESEPELCHAINCNAPAVLAKTADELGALFLHFSTDYVFDGLKTFSYQEQDETCPLSVYGRSKREGEIAILNNCERAIILRTSWVYSLHGKNFLLTIERLAKEIKDKPLRIVDDQFGAPTWSRSLAESALIIATLEPIYKAHGIFHLTSAGKTTWYGFAEAITERLNLQVEIEPIPTSQYPTPAKRPLNSLLDNHKIQTAYGIYLPDWKDSLDLCLKERMSG